MNTGLITSQFGQTVDVTANGQIYRAFVRKGVDVVVGDQVHFLHTAQETVVTERLPRRNVLARRDRYHPKKEIAANIDQVLVMMAVYPTLNEFYLDAYLAGAVCQNLPVIVAINKMDLLPSDAGALGELLAYYEKHFPLFRVSIKDNQGLDALFAALKNKVNVLLGPSGVGKSSLLNRLLGHTAAKVSQVSDATAKGQHTTSSASFYPLSIGGAIIDTPGIREFHLPQDLDPLLGFQEFLPFIKQCEFRNCDHTHTRGCALLKAVADGRIAPWRLKNYYRLASA